RGVSVRTWRRSWSRRRRGGRRDGRGGRDHLRLLHVQVVHPRRAVLLRQRRGRGVHGQHCGGRRHVPPRPPFVRESSFPVRERPHLRVPLRGPELPHGRWRGPVLHLLGEQRGREPELRLRVIGLYGPVTIVPLIVRAR